MSDELKKLAREVCEWKAEQWHIEDVDRCLRCEGRISFAEKMLREAISRVEKYGLGPNGQAATLGEFGLTE